MSEDDGHMLYLDGRDHQADEIRFYNKAILAYFRSHGDMIAHPTRAYFRFLVGRGAMREEWADQLCNADALMTLCRPETFLRVRRELLGCKPDCKRDHVHNEPQIWLPEPQARMFNEQEKSVRAKYKGSE